MAEPLLDPPCDGWQSDLPRPEETPCAPPSLGFDAPNHVDDVYLEISRRWALARGLIIWLTPFLAWPVLRLFRAMVNPGTESDPAFEVVGTLLLLICGWSFAIFARLDISPPRDLPLRFNRARQKIYAYKFQYRWWNPFERWHVVPVAYDWSRVRAEAWKQRGATGNGGVIIKWGVVLSIVAPGTNKVIDRFHLSTMGANEHAWAYVCTYMQQGPSALPPPGEPRDHNAVPWYNVALRLAPKVKWPEAMDIESRTAP